MSLFAKRLIPPPFNSKTLGAWGEDAAARYLRQQGLTIVDHHVLSRWGEIDWVCRDGELWVFVEVKTRARAHVPSALDAVTPAKQRRLVQMALSYMKKKRLEGQAMRFDVLAIEAGRLEWIPNAFEPSSRYTF